MPGIGRYVVLNELGRGAMGVVYEASDPAIGRKVAIKTIRMSDLQDDAARNELRSRLRREAQSAGLLSHPGIVTIYDLGEEGSEAYIVMELVTGTDLEKVLSWGRPQSSQFLFQILLKTAEALDYAHSKGVVHRDIKPSNIMVTQDGAVKITDFGVARISTETALTQTGFVMGTPDYMSPEQARAKPLDGRSDQFSLAGIAYRMLSGKLPFSAPTLTAVLTNILLEEPQFSTAGLNQKVQTVFQRSLHKDPQKRFLSCVDFVRDLEAAYQAVKLEASSRIEAMGRGAESVDDDMTSPLPPLPGTGMSGFAKQNAVNAANDKDSTAALGDRASVTALPAQDVFSAADEAPPTANPRQQEPGGKRIPWLPLAGGIAAVLVLAFGIWAGFHFLPVKRGSDHTAQATPAAPPSAAPAPLQEPAMPLPSAPSISSSTPAEPALPSPPAVAESSRPQESGPANTPSGTTQRDGRPVKPVKKKVEISQRSAPELKPVAPRYPEPPTPNRQTAPAVSDIAAAAPPVEKPAPPAAGPVPTAGVIHWTGRLGKNTVLVIKGGWASIGQVSGELPGVPVDIEIEPRKINVTTAPSSGNEWKLLMLHNGNQACDTIAIRWRRR
jgi:tRNA A-37 threonylcarbamoyl transferase component Bud32